MAKAVLTGMRRYEGSPADKRADKVGAKKAGMSVKAWERSGSDKAADRKAMAKRKGK